MTTTSFDPTDNPFANGTFAPDGNPFRPVSAERGVEAVPDDAAEGTYAYAIVQSGPSVNRDDVELTGVPAIEIMVLWGTQVLHVEHLTPPRGYSVGEEQKKHVGTDFFLPEEKLGTTRLPLVVVDGGHPAVVIPAGATGKIEFPGRGAISLEEARAAAEPCAALAGAHQLRLPEDGRARLDVGGFTFQIAAVAAGKPTARGLAAAWDWTVGVYFGASLLAHTGLMAAMALFVPPMGLEEGDGISKDQLYLVQQYLDAAAEREREKVDEPLTEQSVSESEGGTGERSAGQEGAMGKLEAQKSNDTYGVKGPQDNPDPHISRVELLREATEGGMIGLLNAMLAGDPDAITAPWGRDTVLGADSASAIGAMFGATIGENAGMGGLGLTGAGLGGGYRGESIGLGTIGTLGHGMGIGTKDGIGNGHGRPGGTHAPKAPKMRIGESVTVGHLPKEVIQRVVRQNYGRFRLCYERGLMKNPNLEGRVTVRFVIDRLGAVSNVANGGSDIPDSEVVSCVVRNYYGLSFPSPESGIVTVTYPIMFSPG